MSSTRDTPIWPRRRSTSTTDSSLDPTDCSLVALSRTPSPEEMSSRATTVFSPTRDTESLSFFALRGISALRPTSLITISSPSTEMRRAAFSLANGLTQPMATSPLPALAEVGTVFVFASPGSTIISALPCVARFTATQVEPDFRTMAKAPLEGASEAVHTKGMAVSSVAVSSMEEEPAACSQQGMAGDQSTFPAPPAGRNFISGAPLALVGTCQWYG
mmetsp:Transcript_78620/g.188629  ORF Transcript_78620/g.188629 Transcript_78620/m.188629 type:complete len:218 (+) Transcript_78620:2131-2784(+)